MTTASSTAFAQLSGFLEHDPDNASLLADVAEAALGEGLPDEAARLIARLEALGPLTPAAQHLAGLTALQQQDWRAAADRFEALFAAGHDAPPVRYNLAWALTADHQIEAALPLLDEATSAALPQAAQLEVQLLHQLGDFDRATERARTLIALHPEHRGLNAVVSTLAIDIEDAELALVTARKAGDHPDALATLGTLALGEDDPRAAAELFDAALARNPKAPRAWIGRGLARLLTGDKAEAAAEIDRGASLFGTHPGSWIAAGWSHLLAGDRDAARARFETALALDDRFDEAQGALAVIELLEGDVEGARRRTQIAQRLNRKSFSGSLAAMLLAAGAGDKAKAQRIFETALATPIDGNGRTIAQALARTAGRLG